MKINTKNNLAVKGYDLVEFFSNNAVKGKKSISVNRGQTVYNFSSLTNKEKFEKDPEAYLPQYGGYCAIAMSEGKEADPNPKSFKIQNGKLYLFTRMFWGIIDVQRQWNKDPENKAKLADQEWVKINK